MGAEGTQEQRTQALTGPAGVRLWHGRWHESQRYIAGAAVMLRMKSTSD